MKKAVFALLFAMLAVGLAQDGPGAMGTMTPAARDPRVLALRAEQTRAAAEGNQVLVKELESRIQDIYVESQPQPARDGGGLVQGGSWWEMPESDGPDVLIDTGVVWASAADYEMDGSMYIAYSRGRDSTVRVVKSVDHGSSWQPLTYFYTAPKWPVRRLQLVVGSGDSAFVYVAALHPDNNGDVTCARFNRDGSGFNAFWVSHDSWTINNFTFCRDYVYPYYLYCCAGNDNYAQVADDHLYRSANFARNWAELNTFRWVSDGSYQAGAGSYLYMAGHAGISPYKGQLNLLVNNLYAAPDSWRERVVQPDTFTVEDPVMAPSFVTPAANATIWALYSHDFQNSGDWDIKYVYSTDTGRTWSPDLYLAGTTGNDEHYCDLKPYTDPGNQWMNASYISEASYRTVFRHYVSQSEPTVWSDTLRINTNSAGTGQSIRPLLVYSPGAPGTGAGCVFVGAGLNGLYWNAPWTGVGVAEEPPRQPAVGLRAVPNPLTSRAAFTWQGPARRLAVYDATGRAVRAYDRPASGMAWDRLDRAGARVAAGVYFAELVTESGVSTRQLIVE